MSHQRPIFNSGIYGKANQVVMNTLLEAADAVQIHSAGLEWAQMNSAPEGPQPRMFLARLSTATSLGALTYRWTYAGQAAVLDASNSVSALLVNDSSLQFSGAINLRELFNVNNPVDGMDPNAPQVTVGPVGATYQGNNLWSFDELEAAVVMYAFFLTNGSPVLYFDRPNPVRCYEDLFGGEEGGGGE